jgi:hypothetical protein
VFVIVAEDREDHDEKSPRVEASVEIGTDNQTIGKLTRIWKSQNSWEHEIPKPPFHIDRFVDFNDCGG